MRGVRTVWVKGDIECKGEEVQVDTHTHTPLLVLMGSNISTSFMSHTPPHHIHTHTLHSATFFVLMPTLSHPCRTDLPQVGAAGPPLPSVSGQNWYRTGAQSPDWPDHFRSWAEDPVRPAGPSLSLWSARPFGL